MFLATASGSSTGLLGDVVLLLGALGGSGILGFVIWGQSEKRRRRKIVGEQAVRDNNQDKVFDMVLPDKKGEGGLQQTLNRFEGKVDHISSQLTTHILDERRSRDSLDTRVNALERRKAP